ncbi:MAG TPA: SH3 domain-containing protein [Sphingomicrobium sp.]|nr:SH3 domain-containing protein [Sphingomicrobium sp.]
MGRSLPSPATDGFALGGASDLPDPSTNAYRKDLADVRLAGQVIASHYAEPLVRHLVAPATLLDAPAADAPPVCALKAGDELRVLDISLGWAWGYAPDGRVGYVRAEAIGA